MSFREPSRDIIDKVIKSLLQTALFQQEQSQETKKQQDPTVSA